MTTESSMMKIDSSPVTDAMALPDEFEVRKQFEAVAAFQKLVRSHLIQGHDFGTIPGTNKPTLLKPGAEKIAKLMKLADIYEVITEVEDFDKPLFAYKIRCKLVFTPTGTTLAEGLGECNSYESKYRYREGKRACPECREEAIIKGKAEYGGGWLCWAKQGGCGSKWPDGAEVIEGQKTDKVLNEDIFSQVNTILKMAKKRALVDAALSVGRLSDIFTQDIEDSRGQESLQQTEAPRQTEQAPQKAVQRNEPDGSYAPTQFFKAIKERWNMSPGDVAEPLGVKKLDEIPEKHGSYAQALDVLAEKWGEAPKSPDA